MTRAPPARAALRVNTLGAVAGALTSTFYMLEVFGSLRTLFVAVLINLLVG
jgi:predicted membrane-bound spermidine synthase